MSDPLSTNLDLSAAKTTVPLVADGHLTPMVLDSLKAEQGEKGPITTFAWKFSNEVPTSDGESIKPGDFGSTFYDRIFMYAKEGSKNPTWWIAPLCKRIDGLLGTADAGNAKGKPTRPAVQATVEGLNELAPQLVGKSLVAKMRVTKDDQGNLRNEIGAIYFPGDLPSA